MSGIEEILPLILAATAAAGTVYSATQVGKTPDEPKLPAETKTADTSGEAAQAQANALLKRRGMASTILANPAQGGSSISKQTLGA